MQRQRKVLLFVSLTIGGCESATPLAVRVLLPMESSDYESADNASLVLRPDNIVHSQSVTGTSFSLEFEVDPDGQNHWLDLYLASGERLLAWGQSSNFLLDGASLDRALFLARPSQLSNFPLALERPDPKLLAANARGRGLFLLREDGSSALLNAHTLDFQGAAPSPTDDAFPDPENGGLFSTPNGQVLRLSWESGLQAWAYDPGFDEWTKLSIDDGSANLSSQIRPKSLTLLTDDGNRLFLIGKDEDEVGPDALVFSLQPQDEQLSVAPVIDLEIPSSLSGSVALWSREKLGAEDQLMVFGSDGSHPIFWRHQNDGEFFGPTLAIRGSACFQKRQDDEISALWCFGGIEGRGDEESASSDWWEFTFAASDDGRPEIQHFENGLPYALRDPMIFVDKEGLLIQGEGRLLHFSFAATKMENDSRVTEIQSPSQRAYGGRSLQLNEAATFILGGYDANDRPLSNWQVFAPSP